MIGIMGWGGGMKDIIFVMIRIMGWRGRVIDMLRWRRRMIDIMWRGRRMIDLMWRRRGAEFTDSITSSLWFVFFYLDLDQWFFK
jgi:hypothetical protein